MDSFLISKMEGSKKENATGGTSSMDAKALFQGACSKNGIKLTLPHLPTISVTPPRSPFQFAPTVNVTPARSISPAAQPATYSHPQNPHVLSTQTLPIKLTAFLLFPGLKLEVRQRIWRFAVDNIPYQTLLVQPYNTNHPALAFVNHESRDVLLEAYYMLHSTQVGRMSSFSFFINFDKDFLFLNRRFVKNPRISIITPLIETSLIYRDLLHRVKNLVLKLEDTRFMMAHAWNDPVHPRIRSKNLWETLAQHCPKLRLLCLIDDGSGAVLRLGTQCILFNVEGFQPNRSHDWNVMWFNYEMSLKTAKARKIVHEDLVMRAMDANKLGRLSPKALVG